MEEMNDLVIQQSVMPWTEHACHLKRRLIWAHILREWKTTGFINWNEREMYKAEKNNPVQVKGKQHV